MLAKTLCLNINDQSMMHQTIYSRYCHRDIREDVIPLAEELDSCYKQALAFVTVGNQLKQHTGLCLAFSNINQVIDNQ